MGFFRSGFFGTEASGLGQRSKTNEITTTDATVTDIMAIELAEGQTMTIDVQATGRRTDGVSADIHRSAAFKRDSGGNVTQIGTTQDVAIHYDAGAGSWDATLNADTTNQTVDVRVTGEASQTIQWTVRANYTIRSA